MAKTTTTRTSTKALTEDDDVLQQFPDLYQMLRQIARRERRRNPSDTINTTVVVNEAWLKLRLSSVQWQDQRHYLATAALAMRQLLVDYARRKSAVKRTRVEDCPLFSNAGELDASGSSVLALDEALDRLEELDPRLVRLVELRFFAGLTLAEAAECLDISSRSASREWAKARASIKSIMQA